MKANIETCKETFKLGYEAFATSRLEAEQVTNMYHNRQYTSDQIAVLRSRGQPKETFNIIKLFARMLVGYYSTVLNTATIQAKHPRYVTQATVLNDTLNHIFEQNRFDIEGDKIKLAGLLSGLLVAYTEVVDSGERDQFNRPIYKCQVHYVPESEIVLDPDSIQDDYSDAKYIHRFKWMHEDDIGRTFGKDKLDKLNEYDNYLNAREADYDFRTSSMEYNDGYVDQLSSLNGYSFSISKHYLITHTVLLDEDNKRWSMFWHNDVMLFKEEITFKKVKFPYRVQKLHSSNTQEYYGVFREVIESQNAINQALIQIQQSVNSSKVFVRKDAITDLEQFAMRINRVNAIIPVEDFGDYRIEDMSNEIIQQYTIIDKAFDRIQRVLGINDSFLGMAFASDSGRKVKLQQNATVMSLRYVTARLESFYKSLSLDITALASQFYRAHQFLRITDTMTGERWVEINKPIEMFSGQYDESGQPIYKPVLAEVINPASGEPEVDEEGNLVFGPVTDPDTDFSFLEYDISIDTTSYNDENERAQLMLESVMSGQIGGMLSKVNPAGFFKVSSLSIKTMGTKYSPEIARILDETAQMLNQNPDANAQASLMAQGNAEQGMSQQLKLPTNTNEAV